MSLVLRTGGCSLKGSHRQENEDAIAVECLADVVVCAVADGMGGGPGALASRRALATVLAWLDKPGRDAAGTLDPVGALRHAVARAQDAVVALQQAHRAGSTLT